MSLSTSYDLVFKILILGDSGVGKSAILKQYIDQTFDATYMTTIGIDYACKVIHLQDKKIKLSIWDTAGQERFRSITKAYMRGIQCVLLVYDITDMQSFIDIERWIEMVQAHSYEQHIQYFIIGNKSDLNAKRLVPIEKATMLAEKYNCNHFEVTATNYQSIRDMFYAIAKSLTRDVLKFIPEEISPKININKKDNKKSCC